LIALFYAKGVCGLTPHTHTQIHTHELSSCLTHTHIHTLMQIPQFYLVEHL